MMMQTMSAPAAASAGEAATVAPCARNGSALAAVRVLCGHRETGCQQPLGHRPPHQPGAQKSDPLHVRSLIEVPLEEADRHV
jgi:hypothetical protein